MMTVNHSFSRGLCLIHKSLYDFHYLSRQNDNDLKCFYAFAGACGCVIV